jgi:parvulin-like peptidyl-prolyl isomerase
MRKSWLMCALLGTLAWVTLARVTQAWGQAATGAPSPSQPGQAPADTSDSVAPTAPVITIKGVCAAQPKVAAAKGTAAKPVSAAKVPATTSAADCKTVITKAEFEKLASHLAPNVTPQVKKQLSTYLPQWIATSNAAKKEGLDKTPQFEDRVKIMKMQILGKELQQKIQEDAAKVPPDEIEKYYKEHADTYQQFNVDRLFVPRTKQPDAEAKLEDEKNDRLTEEAQKAKQAEEKTRVEEGERAMSKLAESLRARAAAGEDFAKLQKEAFEAAGMKMQSPTVNLPSMRRTGLPPAQAAAFDLKPGEVSQVIHDAGGHYIYKLNSKSEIPLDQATNEIKGKLQNDRMRQKMDDLNNSFKVETNEAYFGPATPAVPMGGRPVPQMAPPTPRNQNQPNAPAQAPPAAQPQTQQHPPAATPN